MGFQDFIPLILIFAIMYFLLIRPQQKKVKEHQNMVAALRRGDQIVTQGGLIGKVTKVKEENEIEVEVHKVAKPLAPNRAGTHYYPDVPDDSTPEKIIETVRKTMSQTSS